MSQDHHSQEVTAVRCAVVTVSDTRTAETDVGGRTIRELLEAAGHVVCDYRIVPDEPDQVRGLVESLCAGGDCRAVILTGGTGLAARDTTYEAVTALLERRMDGFGELFRMLSYEQVGAKAMLSRAVAGVRGGVAVFALPGSPAAVRLGMEKLVVPVLRHLVALLG